MPKRDPFPNGRERTPPRIERNGIMGKFVKTADKVIRAMIVVLFSLLLLVGFLQIVSRYAFRLPIVWADETMKYLFIWLIMIGAGYGVRLKKHVAADVVVTNVSPKAKIVFGFITDLLSVLLCVMFMILAPRMVKLAMGTTSPTLGIPIGYIYWSMFVGPLIMLFYILIGMYETYILRHPLGGADAC